MPEKLSAEIIRELLDYNPETGRMTWKERAEKYFQSGYHSAEHSCAKWNARFANAEAFSKSNGNGYRQGYILGSNYMGHRVAWVHFYGYWPSIVDHINGDRTLNSILNMRETDRLGNNRNVKIGSKNKSGFIGVSEHSASGKFQAYIGVNGKTKYLGLFETAEQAANARLIASEQYGFHENHGRAK